MRTILVIDDDRDSHLFVRFAIKPLSQLYRLESVTSALEAMQYLLGERGFGDRERYPLPDLILLDLKMPIMDGFQLLEWIRAHPLFGNIPVVVLTGSNYQPDMIRAHQLGANSFVVKALDLLDFADSIHNLLGRFFPDFESAVPVVSVPMACPPA